MGLNQAPSEMVLRVAMAIAAVWGHAPSSWVDGAVQGYKMPRAKRDLFLDAAYKAIEAMREPTEGIMDSAMPWIDPNGGDPDRAWRAMIDAALGEKR